MLVILAAATYLLYEAFASLQYLSIFLIIIASTFSCFALYQLYLCIQWYTFEARKFSVSKEGFLVSCKGKIAFYTWNQIHEVAVVATEASASLDNYQTVICCFLKPKSNSFLHKILRSHHYGALHQEDFVVIDYSQRIERMFTESYPGKIQDYRGIQLPW
jgi:hypothetical protein